MTVGYDSYDAAVIGNFITMLSLSATVQEILGVASAAAAKKYIVESDGGDDLDNADQQPRKALRQITVTACDGTQFRIGVPFDHAFLVVHADEPAEHAELPALGTLSHSGTIFAGITYPFAVGETSDSRMRRARNRGGAIIAELFAIRGQPGCFNSFSARLLKVSLGRIASPYKGTVNLFLQLDWKAP